MPAAPSSSSAKMVIIGRLGRACSPAPSSGAGPPTPSTLRAGLPVPALQGAVPIPTLPCMASMTPAPVVRLGQPLMTMTVHG